MDGDEFEDLEDEDEDFNLTEWLEDWFGCAPDFEGATIAQQIEQTYTTLWILKDFAKTFAEENAKKGVECLGLCRDCNADTAWIDIPEVADREKRRKGAWRRHPVFGLRMCTKCWNTRNGPTCERCGLVMDAGEEVKSGDRYLCKECDKQEREFEERQKQ